MSNATQHYLAIFIGSFLGIGLYRIGYKHYYLGGGEGLMSVLLATLSVAVLTTIFTAILQKFLPDKSK